MLGSSGRRRSSPSVAAALAGSFDLDDPLAHWFPGCKREFVMDDAEDEDVNDVVMDIFKRSRLN